MLNLKALRAALLDELELSEEVESGHVQGATDTMVDRESARLFADAMRAIAKARESSTSGRSYWQREAALSIDKLSAFADERG